jgi:hypothetical protein
MSERSGPEHDSMPTKRAFQPPVHLLPVRTRMMRTPGETGVAPPVATGAALRHIDVIKATIDRIGDDALLTLRILAPPAEVEELDIPK